MSTHSRSLSSSARLVAPLVWVGVTCSAVLATAFAWIERPVDFSLFLRSADVLAHGGNPYAALFENGGGVNLNTPGTVLAFVPLTWMPFPLAFALWYGVSIAAMTWSIRLASRAGVSPLVMSTLSLSLLTGNIALQFGQVTAVLMPLVTGAWLADRTGQSKRAGLLLGFLVYIKPFFGLYLLYWAWRREWRALAAAISVAAVLWGVTVVLSPALTMEWIRGTGDVRWRALTLNGSLDGVASRLFGGPVPYSRPTFTPIALSALSRRVLLAVGSAAILWTSWRRVRRLDSRDAHWSIVGLAALLVSPLGWSYYLPLLAGPLAAVCGPTALLVPLLLLNIPTSVLTLGHYDALGTLTAGSIVWWAFVWLWIGALSSSQSGTRVVDQRARVPQK